jgi:hypothetical protein
MRVWQFVTEQELQGWHSLRADDAGRDHLAELALTARLHRARSMRRGESVAGRSLRP